jgi:hypothetical protein
MPSPGIIVFFFWVLVVIPARILLAFIVHGAGGGVLNLRLGHFHLDVGSTCRRTKKPVSVRRATTCKARRTPDRARTGDEFSPRRAS